MNHLPPELLSKIFLFSDVKEIPSISRVSKKWKNALDKVDQKIWKSIMEKHYPRLAKIVSLYPDGYNWKEGFKAHVASPYEPVGLNKGLQKDLETVFRPRGIVAFSNCCHFGCSGAYNENDPTFRVREDDGIYFIRFSLNGVNYDPSKYTISCGRGAMFGIAASYGTWEYLDEHWEQEYQLLKQFCAVIGLNEGEYNIHKPECVRLCIMIENLKPIPLEEYPDEDSDEDHDMMDEASDEN